MTGRYRGRGVAAALTDHFLQRMRESHVGQVKLAVGATNYAARRFYEKHGWRPNGETRVVPYPPQPLDVGYSYVREEP